METGGGAVPLRRTLSGSPARRASPLAAGAAGAGGGRQRAAPGLRRTASQGDAAGASAGQSPGSPAGQAGGGLPLRRPSWADYTLLQEMNHVAEMNELAMGKLDQLERVVADVDTACSALSTQRETLERELLDWKNLLVQKVEGCYTQVLGQLLEAFDEVEGEALLNREYVSNMLWSTRQLCQSAKEALNSPDLDTLSQIKSRLETKVGQIEAMDDQDFQPKEDTADWSYKRPEIGDEVVWRLMGAFEMGPSGLDSTTTTPVTTPCQENSNFNRILPGEDGGGGGTLERSLGRPTGLPVVSISSHMDENLNLSPCQSSLDPALSDPSLPRLVTVFQTRTQSDTSRCHPVSLAVFSSGEIVIPDKHNRKIKIFTDCGEVVREITHESLKSPTYVALTPDGEIAVCDRKAGDIKLFSFDGACLATIPKLFKSPAGIAFTSSGDLLVGDTGRKAVHVVSLQAATIKSTLRHFQTPVAGTGCREEEQSQLQWPHYVSVSADDVIIVSDRSSDAIQMLDVSGRAIGRFGNSGSGKGRLQSPYGTAIMDNGDILVCDHGNHCLQVLTSSGLWKEPLLNLSQGLHFPTAVQWLGQGRFVVTEYLSGLVKLFQLPEEEGGQSTHHSQVALRAQSPIY